MPIESVSGDLFANRFRAQALAHGCNCRGSMGAGIAIGFRDRYPERAETGWNGRGSGTLEVRETEDGVLTFSEQGTWRPEGGERGIRFSNRRNPAPPPLDRPAGFGQGDSREVKHARRILQGGASMGPQTGVPLQEPAQCVCAHDVVSCHPAR
jgi:hypothetical protein